ncbi:CHRD domain-containing protein [Comamonas koreensis]|uniref:CHRD domain-containing protein n=1 Tax=Comamonas koreensis TaxID=160825 RepID=A0AAW4XUS5_9BURK|nr:CHRD domain-containing protein [Comamonas koreensis]MCD2164880.1 CHRD domain-containing protein [Comamonas koreensis]
MDSLQESIFMLDRRKTLFTFTSAAALITLSAFTLRASMARSTSQAQRPKYASFYAHLDAKYVLPPIKAQAGGSLRSTLDTDSGIFRWEIFLARMTGPETQAAFHGPASKHQNAPALIVLPRFMPAREGQPTDTLELSGTSTLTSEQMDDLLAGRWYISASSAAYPNGELRGQLTRYAGGVHGV